MLGLHTLDRLRPQEAAQAKQTFEQMRQAFLRLDPQRHGPIYDMYQQICTELNAKIQAADPAEQDAIFNYLDEHMVKPIMAMDPHKDMREIVRRVAHVTHQLAQHFNLTPAMPPG